MRKRLTQTLLVAFFLYRLNQVSAQEASLIHYGVDDGLPSNLVYSMTQDKAGFLWFGTDKGLARFDGQRFQVFGMNDGLPDMEILKIMADDKGRLWISPFKQGLCYWQDGQMHNAASDTLLRKINLSGYAVDMKEDNHGNMWLFSGAEAFGLTENGGRKFTFKRTVRHHFQGEDAEYFITLGEIYKSQNQQKETLFLSLRNLLDTTKFNVVSDAGISKDRILICVTNKLILLRYVRDTFIVEDVVSGYAGQVAVSASGDFIVSTFNQGCLFFDCNRGKITLKQKILGNKKINMVFEDAQGSIWFCTPNEGVYALPKNTPSNYFIGKAHISSNISALAIRKDRELIAGNDEGSLFMLHGAKVNAFETGQEKGSNRILKIILDDTGKTIIAADDGIYSLSQTLLERYPYVSTPKSVLYSNKQLWGAFSKDLGYFSTENKQFTTVIHGKRFTSIEQDAQGYIWAGGMDGFYSIADSFSNNLGDIHPLLKSRIIAIAKGLPGCIWVSTAAHGLLRLEVFEGKVIGVELLNDKLSTPIQNIKALYFDKHNKLWLGTNKGVYMIREDMSLIHYDKYDGLADNDINTLLVQEDTLWVGTTKGLTKMLLKESATSPAFPTYIVGIDYGLEDKIVTIPFFGDSAQTRNVSLPPNAKLINISLAGLDYSSRGNIQYEFGQQERFPGFSTLTISNIINLLFTAVKRESGMLTESTLNLGPRLRPGKYQLRFTAINTRGQKSSKSDSIFLTQLPFWYETLWFWLGIFLLVFALMREFYKNRMAYRDLNATVSKLRLQAIQAQMNPHFIGNSIYAIQQFFYPPDPEKASEYIELFNRLLRQTMLMSEQHFVRFSADLEYYQDYLRMIELRFGDRFSYEIEGIGAIPPQASFPAMILQPIIENATIHGLSPAGDSHLKIMFSKEENIVQCLVEDNGVGINATLAHKKLHGTKRKSKGLELLHLKVNTMNRLYKIDLQLKISDLSENNPALHGTLVSLSYNAQKAPDVINPNES